VRHGDRVDSTIILTALGVDLDGNKEVLALRARAEEDKEGWGSRLHDLRARGATQLDLIVTDGHEGVLAAVKELFPTTPRQRCLVHKQRNVLNAIPRRERGDVQAELVGIWKQPTKPEALIELAAENRQVWQALSRGGTKRGFGRRAPVDLFCLSADDASAHSDHQCHRKPSFASCGSAPIRLMCLRLRPVVSRLSGRRSGIFAYTQSHCNTAEN
jgi:hypothetical protein